MVRYKSVQTRLKMKIDGGLLFFYFHLRESWLITKGGQTAILVRWSAAQRTTEMLADQRQRTTKIELPLVRC
jgi:hypothetical protein